MLQIPDVGPKTAGRVWKELGVTTIDELEAAARAELAAQGVAAERLTTVGFGESAPVAENNTSYGRQLNRRVEIKVELDQHKQ